MLLRKATLIFFVTVSLMISVIDWCFDVTATSSMELLHPCQCPCNDSNIPEPPTVLTTSETFTPIEELRKSVDMSAEEGLEYLDEESLNQYHNCIPQANNNDHEKLSCMSHKNCSKARCYKRLKFLNRTKPITALVSFPGSGNTWMRYLIEQASGVFTGSVYCDKGLKIVHPGEHITSANVIVVKTHQAEATLVPVSQEMFGRSHFNQAIFILRNPFDALVSEANRRWGGYGHTGVASENDFIGKHVSYIIPISILVLTGNPDWDWFIQYKSTLWSYQIKTWLDQTKVPVHIVQYENLVANTKQELKKVLQFLTHPVSEKILDCVMEASQGYFKRNRHLNFDPYSQENVATVLSIIRQATPLLEKYGISYTKPLYHQ